MFPFPVRFLFMPLAHDFSGSFSSPPPPLACSLEINRNLYPGAALWQACVFKALHKWNWNGTEINKQTGMTDLTGEPLLLQNVSGQCVKSWQCHKDLYYNYLVPFLHNTQEMDRTWNGNHVMSDYNAETSPDHNEQWFISFPAVRIRSEKENDSESYRNRRQIRWLWFCFCFFMQSSEQRPALLTGALWETPSVKRRETVVRQHSKAEKTFLKSQQPFIKQQHAWWFGKELELEKTRQRTFLRLDSAGGFGGAEAGYETKPGKKKRKGRGSVKVRAVIKVKARRTRLTER